MAINVGGRGKKAPYEATHTRVPVPIIRFIQKWVDDWKEREANGIKSEPASQVWNGEQAERVYPLVEEICKIQDDKLRMIEKLVNDYEERSKKAAAKSSSWYQAKKLVNEIREIL
jgi:hypothetical protein